MSKTDDTQLLPAYLVVGDDVLKREAVVRRLHVRLEKLGDLSFNLDVFNGAHCEGDELVAACNTLPFASEKRLVQINDADKLRKHALEALMRYLSSPSESTVVLLLAEKLSKNTRLYKAIAGLGKQAIIDCARPKSYRMREHVRAMAPTHGITLTDEGAGKLIELVGTDTVRLDSELRKLSVAHEGTQPVDEQEIVELVADVSTVKPWEMADAFAARDLGRCLQYFPRVEGSAPIALLALCTARVRELICAQAVLARGGSTPQIASELGFPEWKVKHYAMWAKQFSPLELRAALASSLDTERAMKSGTPQDAAFIDWLVQTLKR